MSTYSPAPGEGERRAIGGYYPQYRISASLILHALREENLKWIRVADPQAGRVDDLQIGSQSRVDAYQVKWSQYSGNFSFNDLTSGSVAKPSLVAQLADGWMRLKTAHLGHRVVAHLITNQQPSVSDKVPVGGIRPKPHHFAAFIEQALKPFKSSLSKTGQVVPDEWKTAWDALKTASGLSDADFTAFIQDCELDFGYILPIQEAITKDQGIVESDLNSLIQFLFAIVADPQKIVELTRDQLLGRLGWKERFDYKSRHEFPIDEMFYQPVDSTVHHLHDALNTLSGGYIAVLGTPGSGKSSLLTHTLRLRPERVIKYYAYVPDAQDPLALRGESVNFLHDVVLTLERDGFRVGESPSQFDRDQLLERLHQQLNLLHKDWKETGRKTVVLIDGLDHIAREQHPLRSLLLDLPLPEQIPEGIFLVLGSQTDQLKELPDRVQYVIRQPERRIEMASLSREAVLAISARAGLSEKLTENQKEEMYFRSSGHPLALIYILKRICNLFDSDTIDSILQNTDRYEGNIESQYHSYWRQIEADYDLTHLLGLHVRLRGPIDFAWLATWGDSAVLDRLRRQFAHYFRTEDPNRWYFFHNSFRIFLLHKTIETTPGKEDPSRNRAYHHELAERCSQAPKDSYWSWEELYHRASAEDHDAVLDGATQVTFRNQLFAFRPIDAIQADINLALGSAAVRKDPVAIARLVLSGSEMAQREFHLEEHSFVPLLIGLGEKQIATEYMRDGNRLRIDNDTALQLSVDLKISGLQEEGRRIFELAEPLDLLSGTVSVKDPPTDQEDKLLETWVTAAINYRKLNEVIEIIQRIRREPSQFGDGDGERATFALRNNLLYHAGLALLRWRRWEDLSKIVQRFDINHEDGQEWWFWLQVHSWKACIAVGDGSRAKGFLEETLRVANSWDLNSKERVSLGEAIYQILRDADNAYKMIEGVSQPELKTDIFPSQEGIGPFLQRFRLNRLLYALGSQVPPSEIIPDSPKPSQQGMVYFERALCVISRIWAQALRGRKLDEATIGQEVFPLLRLFSRPIQETREWTTWYIATGRRDEFYRLLVDAVVQHGFAAIEALRGLFQKEWDQQETSIYWSVDLRRQVILALQRVGVESLWIIEQLKKLEDKMLEGLDVSSRINECLKHAKAWLSLNDREQARKFLIKALQGSFGVGYRKDYQVDKWVWWLEFINKYDPGQAAERISWFAGAIASLEETTEGRASWYAAIELLSISFKWSPRRTILLLQWFLDRGIIPHQKAISTLLRAALKSELPPVDQVCILFEELHLPITDKEDADLAALLIEKVAMSHRKNAATQVARNFLLKVNVYALPSTRAGWRRGVARALFKLGLSLESIGLNQTDIRPDEKEEGFSSRLKLKDNSTLSAVEVETLSASLPKLCELLENEIEESYFDWAPAIKNIVKMIDLREVHGLVSLFRGKRYSEKINAVLCERLHNLGDTKGAWALAEQALKTSKSYGWDQWYDGGSRIAAFEALVYIDPQKARPLVYETLIRDLTSEFRYPQNIALNLDKILPLLTDDIPFQNIWEEIDQHLRVLFENSLLPTDSPKNLHMPIADDTPARAIVELLSLHLNHPVTVIVQAAQRAFVKLFIQYDSALQNAAKELLKTTESYQERILLTLEAVSLQESKAVAILRDEIMNLQQSPNFAVRKCVKAISSQMGWELDLSTKTPVPLPVLYALSLRPRDTDGFFGRGSISSDKPLPDSEDPGEVVRPFDLQLGFIADETQIPLINLCYRAVQIMRQLSPEEDWSASGEKKLRSKLESIGLRLPFTRPRAALARKATFHIIAELLDAGVMNEENIYRLKLALRFYDPMMVSAEPLSRPVEVAPTSSRRQYEQNHDEWMEQVAVVPDSIAKLMADGRIVLAEETTLKRLEWAFPKEIRRAVIHPLATPASTIGDSSDLIFDTVKNRLVKEYPNLRTNKTPVPLILRHTVFTYDTPAEHWLALNPTIANGLGWRIAVDGFFRWLNENGEIMVESIWWADGLIDHSLPHSDDEVGEGWLVVASRSACDAIIAQIGDVGRLVHVERSYYKDGQPMERAHRSEQPI